MRKHFSFFISTLALTFIAGFASAQIVSSNLFLQGKYLEIGCQQDGSLGTSINAPSGYHPHGGTPPCGGSSPLASVYDWGKDGWSTGTPNYMGDYTLPGSPWEEWAIETGGTMCVANSESCSPSGTLTGSFTSFYHSFGSLGPWYSNYGSRAIGIWSGSVGSGAALTIRKEHRVDTFSSAVVITTVLTNTTSSPITGVYYMRCCDPDNDETWSGGSFTTDNVIAYQNDYYHRVLVNAYATGSTSATGIPAAPYSLGTKDCRAKAVIFSSWPMSASCDLAAVYAGSASCLGTSYYAVNTNAAVVGDIAIGLVYSLGDIAAHDSVLFSYAYIYNGTLGVDSAFPNPKMVINGVGYDSFALLTACGTSLGDTLPVEILYGTDKCWSWSHWSWASSAAGMAALLTDTGVVNGIVVTALTATTTYTITGTQNMSDCAAHTFVITIVPTSTGLPDVTDVHYCVGDAASALTATGINLLWYTTATGGTGSTTAPTPSTATAGVTTYYVTDNPCGVESHRVAITVYVTPRPVVHATNNGPICAGSTLDLYGNDTFTTGTIVYAWDGPGTFTSAVQNPSIPSATIADSGMYIVSLTVNGCASLPDTELVVVHSAPPAPVTTNVTYCQYAATVPLIVTGVNLEWYTLPVDGTGTPGVFTPSSATPGTFTYYFTQTTNGCESPRAALVVTINPKPAAPTPTPPTYCQFDTPTPLTATGTSLEWYSPGGASSATAPTPSTSTAGVFVYYVTQTVSGCVSDSASDPVTIIAKPAPPTVLDTEYCQGSPSVALSAGGTDISWYTTSAGGTALTAAPVPTTSTVGSTTWYVSQTVNGCESNRTPITATILYLPIFTITQSRPYVCQYDTLTFSYNGPALSSPVYSWTMPTGATYVSGVASDPTVVARFDSLYMQDVVLTAGDYGGKCFTSDTVQVHVVYRPDAISLVSTHQNLCVGDTLLVALASHSANADHYTWDFSGGTVVTANSNSGGPYTITWGSSYSGIEVISVTAYSAEGCPGIAEYDTIDLHRVPNSSFLVVKSPSCIDDSLTLCHVTSGDETGYSFRWTPTHFFEGVDIKSNDTTYMYGRAEVSGLVYLTVTDPYGCTSVDSILVTPHSCCEVYFPTAFIPSTTGGTNSHFRPLFMGNSTHTFSEFRITNRWGQTVYESASSEPGWDGTLDGVPQDLGVYYYFIKYTCTDDKGNSNSSIQKGEVTLVR